MYNNILWDPKVKLNLCFPAGPTSPHTPTTLPDIYIQDYSQVTIDISPPPPSPPPPHDSSHPSLLPLITLVDLPS